MLAARKLPFACRTIWGLLPKSKRFRGGIIISLYYESNDPNNPIKPQNYRDSNDDGLVHIAARRRDLRTVQLLVSGRVAVDLVGDMGCTALHYANYNGHVAVVAHLLENGASPNVINEFGKRPAEKGLSDGS